MTSVFEMRSRFRRIRGLVFHLPCNTTDRINPEIMRKMLHHGEIDPNTERVVCNSLMYLLQPHERVVAAACWAGLPPEESLGEDVG